MAESVKSFVVRQLAALVLSGLAACPLLLAASQAPQTIAKSQIEGDVRVVDGDTVTIGETRVRLEGIDAPETTQTCNRARFGTWRCGEEATRYLVRLIGTAGLRCDDLGLDKYGRTLGRCFAGDVNVNAEMVRTGHAWAFVKYSRSYVAEEAAARAARAGIWQGDAMPAWDYRARAWDAAETQAPQGCAIKGNVTNAGRIYHTPWSPWYDKVRMDQDGRGTVKGKRWFCSETEAVAAGWRAAVTR